MAALWWPPNVEDGGVGRLPRHLAGAATGTDENVARLLEQTADRALRRGGAMAAISALEKAARLGDGTERARRLLRAAELAAEAGRRDDVERILLEVRGLNLTPRERALATWLSSAFDDGVGEGPGELVGLSQRGGSTRPEREAGPARDDSLPREQDGCFEFQLLMARRNGHQGAGVHLELLPHGPRRLTGVLAALGNSIRTCGQGVAHHEGSSAGASRPALLRS